MEIKTWAAWNLGTCGEIGHTSRVLMELQEGEKADSSRKWEKRNAKGSLMRWLTHICSSCIFVKLPEYFWELDTEHLSQGKDSTCWISWFITIYISSKFPGNTDIAGALHFEDHWVSEMRCLSYEWRCLRIHSSPRAQANQNSCCWECLHNEV